MKAYSYIRWSSGSKEIGGYGQSSGDSLRRQIEETEKFCKAKGWHLDEEKMVDVSVSGYKGKNVSKGALGEFIRAVDNGEIPVPCICVIEQLDRLKHILSTAKNAMGAPGFRGARVDWHILGPWYEQHKAELEELSVQSIEEIKRQNLQKDGILKDLEIAKRKREWL